MTEPAKKPAYQPLHLPADLYARRDCDRKHNSATYIWLAYSIFFFVEPVMRRSVHYWMHQLPFFLVFLGLYVAYVEFERRGIRLALIACIFVLGVITIPSNVGGSSFVIYVAALLPFCVQSYLVMIGAMLVELAGSVGFLTWLSMIVRSDADDAGAMRGAKLPAANQGG